MGNEILEVIEDEVENEIEGACEFKNIMHEAIVEIELTFNDKHNTNVEKPTDASASASADGHEPNSVSEISATASPSVRVVKGFFVIRYWVRNRPVIRYWGGKNAFVIRYCLKIKSAIRNSTKISYRDPLC